MIECLICGKKYKRPCGHVRQVHGITAREYKEAFGLDLKKGIITPEDREKMRLHAIANNMPERLGKAGKKTQFKKGHNINYERSEQTVQRLRAHWSIVSNKKGRKPIIEKITIQCALCGQSKQIQPKYYKKDANYCGVVCRNRAINIKRHEKKTDTRRHEKNNCPPRRGGDR